MTASAAELVERCRADLDRIEMAMLADEAAIEALRPARELALRGLLDAQLRLVAEERAEERRPTREELEAFWSDCRILGRKRMSARTKAKAIRWFGGRRYMQLPS